MALSLKMGAIQILQRWVGQKPDSSFQTLAMNSFNHFSVVKKKDENVEKIK